MKKLTFPDDFWWGSAWSGGAAEGKGETGKAATIWSRWFNEPPYRFNKPLVHTITPAPIHQ